MDKGLLNINMKIIIALISSCILFGCSNKNELADNIKKDPNITKGNCVALGSSYDVPPAGEVLDKCCSGYSPSSFSTSLDGSTGYRHFKCVRADTCYKEGETVEPGSYIKCCSGLVVKNDKCINKTDCMFGSEKGILITSSDDLYKLCVKLPDCTKSGEINQLDKCQYCCPGSKMSIDDIIPLPHFKCFAEGEELSAEDKKKYEILQVITQEDVDEFIKSCYE